MAEELTGNRITIRRAGEGYHPVLPNDPEALQYNVSVGPVLHPEYYIIYAGYVAIGDCVAYNPDGDSIEIGISLMREYRGRGYGTESIALFSRHYLQSRGYYCVHLKVIEGNIIAIRAYERAGFVRCGKIVVDSIEFVKMERRRL